MLLMRNEDLKELLNEKTGPCVTIYMPTEKGSIETKQNPVRFRKLLRDAEHKLAASAVKRGAIEGMTAPAHRLLEDHMFWQYQLGGLAVFLSPSVKRAYTLPLKFTELAAVADRFCVRQLLPLFAEAGRFCVLAVGRRSVRLYQCGRYEVSEVDLRQAPKDITELLEFNPGEKQLQFHSNTVGGAARRRGSAVFHGHGEDTDEDKENVLTYFRNVNRAVNAILGAAAGPLVLAGDDRLARLYEDASTYPRLAGRVRCNPAELRPEELRDKAWEKVRPLFEETARAESARFGALEGTPQASKHLKTILAAANEGRVETLFVSSGERRWGFFDDASGIIDLHEKADPCDMELLELCVVRTLDRGGKVYALEAERMPGRAPAAAIFRY